AIGDVNEVHCWSDRPIWPQGYKRPTGQDPVPANLDWDLWIGPAPMRPFVQDWPEDVDPKWKGRGAHRPVYHPFAWRGWWDFGCGALGDMACHIMDAANWPSHPGSPTSVELMGSPGPNDDMAPAWSVIKYELPQRDKMPPEMLNGYDGA